MSIRNEESLKNVIEQMMDAYGMRERYEQALLMQHWEEWMGKTIAKYTTDLYVKEGILNIYITSSPLKQELNASKNKIIKLINDKLGKELLKEVIIK